MPHRQYLAQRHRVRDGFHPRLPTRKLQQMPLLLAGCPRHLASAARPLTYVRRCSMSCASTLARDRVTDAQSAVRGSFCKVGPSRYFDPIIVSATTGTAGPTADSSSTRSTDGSGGRDSLYVGSGYAATSPERGEDRLTTVMFDSDRSFAIAHQLHDCSLSATSCRSSACPGPDHIRQAAYLDPGNLYDR